MVSPVFGENERIRTTAKISPSNSTDASRERREGLEKEGILSGEKEGRARRRHSAQQ